MSADIKVLGKVRLITRRISARHMRSFATAIKDRSAPSNIVLYPFKRRLCGLFGIVSEGVKRVK